MHVHAQYTCIIQYMYACMHLPNGVCPDACAASSSASIYLRCGLFPDGLHFWTHDIPKTPLFYLLLLKAPLLHLRSSLPHTAEHRRGLARSLSNAFISAASLTL